MSIIFNKIHLENEIFFRDFGGFDIFLGIKEAFYNRGLHAVQK